MVIQTFLMEAVDPIQDFEFHFACKCIDLTKRSGKKHRWKKGGHDSGIGNPCQFHHDKGACSHQGMICPLKDATASTQTNALGYPRRVIAGSVNEPVDATFAKAEPEMEPKRADESTETLLLHL